MLGSWLCRPWLGVPFGMFSVITLLYFWWLITKVKKQDTQIQMLKLQSLRYQDAMESYKSSKVIPFIPDKPGAVCETIHISILFMGSSSIQYLSPMLKSLLYYRQNPLHFHFIVDSKKGTTLRKLFEVWNLPDVRYTHYNGEKYFSELSWIPHNNYAGAYPFIKLLLPSDYILPASMAKVIVLDCDLIFFSDVAELWAMFRNMTDEQFIGLVENESDFYYEPNRWPALRRGFNIGVMLLNLDHVRKKTNWTTLWQVALRRNLKKLQKTTLAEQDVINAVIKRYPWILYEISCRYNVQMSQTSIAKNCYGEDQNNVKILHWNNPLKNTIKIPDANYFRSRHDIFVNLDITLLREKLHRCWNEDLLSGMSGSETYTCLSSITFLPLLLSAFVLRV